MTDPAARDRRHSGGPDCWDAYFAPGGDWERNGGRKQTRVFARCFCKAVRFDASAAFSLLDLGCALGEAIRVLHRRYPAARLTGMDISRVAIDRCRSELGHLAAFRVGGMTDIEGHYDVIHTSNVLEHFVDHRGPARALLAHCDRLCIMVPFEETDQTGNPLQPKPCEQDGRDAHHRTFFRDSFHFLIAEGLAESIAVHTMACPGAWGSWNAMALLRHRYKNFCRRLKGKPPRPLAGPLQVVYDVSRSAGAGDRR
jgi:SAM-dependent methyltransferase